MRPSAAITGVSECRAQNAPMDAPIGKHPF